MTDPKLDTAAVEFAFDFGNGAMGGLNTIAVEREIVWIVSSSEETEEDEGVALRDETRRRRRIPL